MNRTEPLPPLENSYWVVPGSFLAGQYPGSLDKQELETKLNLLLAAGVLTILNLMEEKEVNLRGIPFAPYERELERLAKAQGLRTRTIRFPMPDFNIPTRALMKQILDAVDRSMDQGRPAYVHCLGGRGRTGTVVGCYLRRHNLAGAGQVLEALRELREKGFRIVGGSPETEAQRSMVRSWPGRD